MDNTSKEFKFLSNSIIVSVIRGILVGLLVGVVVSLFRLLIEIFFKQILKLYALAHQKWWILGVILIINLLVVFLVGLLVKSDKDIKGSGVPQVEAELKGLMQMKWDSVLWKKFVGGVLAISTGLMLGREGPSIELGAVAGQGISKALNLSKIEERSLIASGAAAGLAAAFNAPIAGLLFVVEEVYHHFSRVVWVSALAASLTSNFITQNILGLKPVLAMPNNIPHLALHNYWIYILFGLLLGLLAYIYEKVVLNLDIFYQFVNNIFHIKPYFQSIVALLLIIPIGYFAPLLLGGGNRLILSLPTSHHLLWVIILFFVIRFIWSMLSYGGGLPGGIFLPILTLGALLGLAFGTIFMDLHIISHAELPIFIIAGMAGYFGAICKAPLTAVILVTEMVGDLHQLMALGTVTLIAYIIIDLLKGAPVYEAMLEKLIDSAHVTSTETTMIQIPVSDKLSGKRVFELDLPHDMLITTQVHNGISNIVSGSNTLYLGDTIYVVVRESDIGKARELLL